MSEKFLYWIKRQTWKFAKTMPKHPHWYSLIQEWANREEFYKFAQFIIDNGYKDPWFNGKYFVKFNINGYSYWTCGLPARESTLINRAKVNYGGKYDKIAEKYDEMHSDKYYTDEDRYITSLIRPSKRILDVGCGTGLFLKHRDLSDFEQYIGIDISQGMLDVFKKEHGSKNIELINTVVSDFYWQKKIHSIIALFGTASYLTVLELERLRWYLSDGGQLFLMFYYDGYKPKFYDEINDSINIYLNESDGERYNNYIIVTENEIDNLIGKLKQNN